MSLCPAATLLESPGSSHCWASRTLGMGTIVLPVKGLLSPPGRSVGRSREVVVNSGLQLGLVVFRGLGV